MRGTDQRFFVAQRLMWCDDQRQVIGEELFLQTLGQRQDGKPQLPADLLRDVRGDPDGLLPDEIRHLISRAAAEPVLPGHNTDSSAALGCLAGLLTPPGEAPA